jgi:serine O-acetyltransferase
MNERISATVPDWSREQKRAFEWSPDKSLLASIRAYQHHAARKGLLSALLRRWQVLRHRFWSVVSGADIPICTQIGGGLRIPHPNGIVIHADARIGPNCQIMQQVTIGVSNAGPPIVGGHVDFGAGAKVIGQIVIHDHAQIGANAVVVKDVPPYATAIGVPARLIARPQSITAIGSE